MPSDGVINFGDLIGQLKLLRVECRKCDRLGIYSVRQLALEYGREAKIPDWIELVTRDCPRKQPGNISDRCAASCPDLVRIVQQGPRDGGNDGA